MDGLLALVLPTLVGKQWAACSVQFAVKTKALNQRIPDFAFALLLLLIFF